MFYRNFLIITMSFFSLKAMKFGAVECEHGILGNEEAFFPEMTFSQILQDDKTLECASSSLHSLLSSPLVNAIDDNKFVVACRPRVSLVGLVSDEKRNKKVTDHINTHYNLYASYLPLFLKAVHGDWSKYKLELQKLLVPQSLSDYLYKEHRNKQNRVYALNRKIKASSLDESKKIEQKLFQKYPDMVKFKHFVVAPTDEYKSIKRELKTQDHETVARLRRIYSIHLKRYTISSLIDESQDFSQNDDIIDTI